MPDTASATAPLRRGCSKLVMERPAPEQCQCLGLGLDSGTALSHFSLNAIIPRFIVHAKDCGVGRGADEETSGDHRIVVARLRVDVLDAVDALDDRLHRLGNEFDGVLRLEARRLDVDVHQRDGNLRLFLARKRDERDQTDRQGGDDE